MKTKITLTIITGLIITFAACKKSESPTQSDVPQDNALLAMESELKLMGHYVDSLSNTNHVGHKAHHDSMYHVHHHLFLQHHSKHAHVDAHDTLHHDSHSIHNPTEHNDSLHGNGHDDNHNTGHHDSHHTGHHHTLDSLHTIHLLHFKH